MPVSRALHAAFAVITLAALAGCGGAYAPGRVAGFDLDSDKQIDDDDIRKAFDARPQMPDRMAVAYYTFDPEIGKDVEATLAALPGVERVYRIPPLLVNGQRRIDEQNPWAPRREVTVKKLRLLAARAHTDVLVVVDHGYRTGGINGLFGLNLFLLPIFFSPFLDNSVSGYAESFVIDTRNGHLYGHTVADDKRGDGYATIYSKSVREVEREQWAALRGALQRDLTRLVAKERSRDQEARVTARR